MRGTHPHSSLPYIPSSLPPLTLSGVAIKRSPCTYLSNRAHFGSSRSASSPSGFGCWHLDHRKEDADISLPCPDRGISSQSPPFWCPLRLTSRFIPQRETTTIAMAPGPMAQWESTVKHLLVATLLISGLAECLVIPVGNADGNGVSSAGGAAEQGGNGYPYVYALTAQCMNTPLDEMPPRLRRLCAALSTISNLSNGIERYYIDDKAMRDNGALLDSGVKRQDVDHVFLRFGRSR